MPDRLDDIPPEVREFIAGQIGLLWDCSESYPWHSSTFDHHLAQVRESTGWRFATSADKEALEFWLRQHGAYQAHTDELLLASACARLRSLRIELPAKRELERVVSAALNGFYQDSTARSRTVHQRRRVPGSTTVEGRMVRKLGPLLSVGVSRGRAKNTSRQN